MSCHKKWGGVNEIILVPGVAQKRPHLGKAAIYKQLLVRVMFRVECTGQLYAATLNIARLNGKYGGLQALAKLALGEYQASWRGVYCQITVSQTAQLILEGAVK